MKKDKNKNSEETPQNDENAENDSSNIESELRRRLWTVVSFEQCMAKNLTYREAEEKIAELEKQGVSGLCVVTDTVASRIVNRC